MILMPKIIMTSRYLKSGSKRKSNYVKYIATREGSAKVDFPELIDNSQFKSVKNMIIKTVSEIEDNQNQNFAETAFKLLLNFSRMIEENYHQSERTLQSQTDSKLRRIIRRKKLELGIREEYEQKL